MSRAYLLNDTIERLISFLKSLAYLGEISSNYGLSESHRYMVLRSGLAICTMDGFVVTPRLLNLFPADHFDESLSDLNLSPNNTREWGNFEEKIHSVHVEDRFEQLGFQYAFIPKTELIFEDHITRPVFYYRYIDNQTEIAEWDFADMLDIGYPYIEPKTFVHSTLPVNRSDYGLSAFQLSLWHNPFYWTVLQLLLLSDYQTGSAYEYKIHLVLLDGFDNDGKLNIYFNNEYVCDFRMLLKDIFSHFNWIWINPTDEIMGIFKLLYKLDVMDKERNGRAILTNEYRCEMLERNSKHAYQYRLSRAPRDWMREMIKKRRGDVS